ncbi:hypothetical protein [Chitinimonas sp. BJB300]|uniref:hypothetical protein n=1 Tax=Chitinimonas sp. BJB300 TaxID=1559339 RepID=UPI000C0CD99D|nr:hypothetical protein [Chitinimonas sp. BJB300]PHV10498.1 hypothetical protein CSQ89_15940 [Chitinimonas sp. BJB300]TSJ89879.1 hypothetical protein FG002_006635 [Chitinimonas sp. BJB300]
MTISPDKLQIELAAPQRVGSTRAAYQSLWLLVRMYQARRIGGPDGLVRLTELRQQFLDTRSLRMVVSRAYRDFARWGVRAGWGENSARDPRFLNPEGRSQGPFWLPLEEAERIEICVEGRPADASEVADFLGQADTMPWRGPGMAYGVEFWLALALAQQDLRQDRLLAVFEPDQAPAQGALAGFKQAAGLASGALQQALAALGEAAVWRRLDDLGAARQTLAQLRRALKEAGADEGGYLDAMEQILTAWCAYAQRDSEQASAILTDMAAREPRAGVVRHHPRVRFEWHNLMALIRRLRALGGSAVDLAIRRQEAMAAQGHFHTALQAAFEFGSFDAAQQAAANAGMAVWLFAGEGLLDDAAGAEATALRWLLLSEYLCHCSRGEGLSAWNAIYLMRIARGPCPRLATPTLAQFQALLPRNPAQLQALAGMLPGLDKQVLLPDSWLSLAESLLQLQREGRARYSLLQRCGLWFEHAWYALHTGQLAAADASLCRLTEEMSALPASDRAFFVESWRTLPSI